MLVDNDPVQLADWGEMLQFHGYEVIPESSLEGAKYHLNQEKNAVQVIVTDLHLERDEDATDDTGLRLLRDFGANWPVIILTGLPTVEAAIKALTRGKGNSPAFALVRKMEDGPKVLLRAIREALKRYALSQQGQVGGALSDDKDYVIREAEQEISRRLEEKMEYLLIIEPRQQGKTSMINFFRRKPPFPGAALVYVDMSTLNGSTEEVWYESFCERLRSDPASQALDLSWPPTPRERSQWRSFLLALTRELREHQLYLILALDEIGAPFPGMEGFFSVLREMYNDRQSQPSLRHITFMLTGAFHPRDLISDDRISPFNVAHRVRLPDFSPPEIAKFVSRIVVSEERARDLAESIHFWTGGQPYLTQYLCSLLHTDSSAEDVKAAVKRLRREDENHVPPILKALTRYPEGMEYIKRILDGEKIEFNSAEVPTQGRLELLGLIASDEAGFSVIRNRIYLEALKLLVRPEVPAPPTLPEAKPKVFVAHGHDEAAKLRLRMFLEQVELTPVILQERSPSGQTIIEAFEEQADVDFAIVLVTPDDEGREAGREAMEPRPRQNVIFELGYFVARLGRRRVAMLCKQGERIALPSNYDGVFYEEMDPGGGWQFKIARAMDAVGIGLNPSRLFKN